MATPTTANPVKKAARLKRVVEQFDLNTATVAGTIIRLWGRSGDVFARLRVSLRGELRETDDAQSIYVNVRIPNGMVKNQPVTLQPDEIIMVKGYMTHASYDETLRKFLQVAGESSFLDENIPAEDLETWRSIQFKRQNAILNAVELTPLAEGRRAGLSLSKPYKIDAVNFVDLEGIVVKTWEYRRDGEVDLFMRIAVYDEWTTISREKKGNFGRPFRQPHYINILLPGGRTSQGKNVSAKIKQRIRVRGEIRDKGHRMTLHESLLALGSSEIAEMMGRVINAERMQEISAQQESLHVLANAVIVYN
jgi:hypothetical protein